MSLVVVTLAEKQYHLGVGALANSLARSGFRGEIRIGFRGPLPRWVREEGAREDGLGGWILAKEGAPVLIWRPCAPEIHFANWKPDWMQQVLAEVRGVDGIVYFDPDIVVRCPWPYVEEWVEAGIAVVADVNADIGATHPIRWRWEKDLGAAGIPVRRRPDRYVNSGFCGVSRERAPFLEDWRRAVQFIGERTARLGAWSTVQRPDPYSIPDQDALNIAMMTAVEEPSLAGPDAMDFAPGGFVMSHAIGSGKPWNRRNLRLALQGHPPRRVDKEFWEQLLRGPFRVLPRPRVRFRQLEIAAAAALGRFIRRA